MLVVNVSWKGKKFVGTLLDATVHEWAPPRYLKFIDFNICCFLGAYSKSAVAASDVYRDNLRCVPWQLVICAVATCVLLQPVMCAVAACDMCCGNL